MMAMTPDVPFTRELVLVGGGHTHALVLRAWGMKPVPGVRLTLINPGPTAPYSGMLPGHIAGHYTRDALKIDLVSLARHAGARLVLGAVDVIDPVAQRVQVPGRAPMAYDTLSIDVGITAKMDALPGFATHGIPAKPLETFATRWDAYCAGDGPARIAVIGGGVAGMELALACAHRMQVLGRDAAITVLDRGAVLDRVASSARQRLLAAAAGYGIALVDQATVTEVTATDLQLADGQRIASDFTIGAAGAVPHPWLAETGLAVDDGYVTVDEYLRSTSHPNVYAAGDCAHLSRSPRPKAGVYAVRAAPILAHNLRADLVGHQRRAFHPQRDFLKLISLGQKQALAEKAGITLAGAGMWRWKNRIDQAFMDKFRHLPPMPTPIAPRNAAKGVAGELSGPMPCGGCGAKLGPDALSGVLSALPRAGRADVETTPGDDAAVLNIAGQRQVLTTDHLRAFAEDPVLMTRVTAVHALGDIWAMGATPQAAMATVILPRMAARMQGPWLDEIMSAARDVFAAEGAEIVGGHSSMGTELTLGFSITGVLDRPAITLSGARPGDLLILTKPIGSGTVLAAEMRGKARGSDVADVWAMMTQGQAKASALLAPVARAMTDVTGFGLAGHLANICEASGVGADVTLDGIPLYPGALRLAETGIRSTLFAQNRAALAARVDAPETALADLVFDPQTAGGLLAAIDPGAATETLAALNSAGVPATQIGQITATERHIRLT